MNFFKRLFSKDIGNYRPRTLWDFFMRFYESDRERLSMLGYMREHGECGDHDKRPSKKLMRRYLIKPDQPLLQWYLLEKYYEGKITIKEDEKSFTESGTGAHS